MKGLNCIIKKAAAGAIPLVALAVLAGAPGKLGAGQCASYISAGQIVQFARQAVLEEISRNARGTAGWNVQSSYRGDLCLPQANLTYNAACPAGVKLPGSMTVRVDIYSNHVLVKSIWVPMSVTMTASAPVATRNMSRGDIINGGDVTFQNRGFTSASDMSFPSRVDGMRLKRSVRAGQVITASMLEKASVVERNKSVTLVANGPGISVSCPGKALQDGAPGDRIRVKNESSGRIVDGIVNENGEVEVDF